jgi:UTP--glucose-1-phosphate uridylyltransferase
MAPSSAISPPAILTPADAPAALARYGFSADQQASFAARAQAASTSNAVQGRLLPLPASALHRLPPPNTPERRALRDEGLRLLRAGKVGVVVLAGGMATRFGGVVKAVVPAHGALSFLACKVKDVHAVATAAGGHVPLYVMSSFATHDTIVQHVADASLHSDRAPIEVFAQKVALRLTPDGALFVDDDGGVSPYATGHGDLVDALRDSGVLGRFLAGGGETLFMTNVDNLGATLDPAMVALHARGGAAITVEVVPKNPGDAGGAPALLDGIAQIIEGFRFPKDFDQSTIGVFNTNTLFLQARALDRSFPLPYYRVEKKVEKGGAPTTVVQFERLVGELTAFLPSAFVEVPRTGVESRFIAVKDPSDLERQRETIARVVESARGVRDLRPDEL